MREALADQLMCKQPGVYILRHLQSYFSIWRQKSWFCLTANFKMNLLRVHTAPRISLGDILYLCHTPSRGKDADGCSLYWEDGLMVITSLVFPPFAITSAALSFNFVRLSESSGRRKPSAMNHTMHWIKCNNRTSSRVAGIRKWSRQNRSHRHKQRHPSEQNMFDADENMNIQENSVK